MVMRVCKCLVSSRMCALLCSLSAPHSALYLFVRHTYKYNILLMRARVMCVKSLAHLLIYRVDSIQIEEITISLLALQITYGGKIFFDSIYRNLNVFLTVVPGSESAPK